VTTFQAISAGVRKAENKPPAQHGPDMMIHSSRSIFKLDNLDTVTLIVLPAVGYNHGAIFWLIWRYKKKRRHMILPGGFSECFKKSLTA